MKLRENVIEQKLEIEGFNFEEVFNKTLEEVKKSYFDSPELFVEQFIKNAPQLQELGTNNKWESSEDVYKEVDKRIRDKKLIVVSENQLAQLVITVLSEEFVEPKQNAKPKKAAPKKIKPKDIVYKIEESLIGKEVVVDSNTVIIVTEFEEYSKKANEHPHSLQWEEDKVTLVFEEIEEKSEDVEDDEEDFDGEDDE